MTTSKPKCGKRPPRLPEVFQSYGNPLYFVTLCTMDRQPLLANKDVHNAFTDYARRGLSNGLAAVGRYVIMPDHVHVFVRCAPGVTLGRWVKGLKVAIGSRLPADTVPGGSIWQPGFFDHLLRHNESYAEKWAYVVDNPVRKKVVSSATEWPYQGEIAAIDRV